MRNVLLAWDTHIDCFCVLCPAGFTPKPAAGANTLLGWGSNTYNASGLASDMAVNKENTYIR